MSLLHRLRRRLACLSMFHRIVIGNTLIIILGAVGGTLLTRHLADRTAAEGLILLFALSGTALTILTNCLIVRAALQPLHELQRLIEEGGAPRTAIDDRLFAGADPDTRQLANTLSSLVQQLEARNRQLRALSRRATNAQEEERRRIARSLHDDTGQTLSTLIINLERLEKRLPSDPQTLGSRLASARLLAQQSLKELRKIVYGLRPTILDDLGLVPAIRWYARSNLEEAGVRLQLEVPDEPVALPARHRITLFRIAQEAVNNVLRHAQASTVNICLHQDERSVYLSVQDDGRGFDVTRIRGEALSLQHLGLLGIQERADLVGGQVTVDSAPGRGTRLAVCLPLATAEPRNG